jgi:Kef-type K+ transport system membrane component KefB
MMVLVELLVILFAARACGEVAVRVGSSAAIGEIVAGIVLALIAGMIGGEVRFFRELLTSEVFQASATAGIFFLVLLAGLELKPRDIAEHSGASFLVALGGVVVPLGSGIALGFWLLPPSELLLAQALLIGVAMAITAIPASVRILEDLGLVTSRLGRTIIAAALFDDIIGLVLLAVLTAVVRAGSAPALTELALILGKTALFFAVTVSLGVHVYPRVSRGLRTLQATSLELSALLMVAFLYGVLAELLGIHWILGPFMAGLYFEPDRVGLRAYDGIRLIVAGATAGFFGPVFFASIGVRVELDVVTAAPVLLVAILAAAMAGKVLGAGLPALAAGFAPRDALAVGVGMSSRGAVELVILSIAVDAGIITVGVGDGRAGNLYSCLILMAVVTTLAAPILLNWILKKRTTEPTIPPPPV